MGCTNLLDNVSQQSLDTYVHTGNGTKCTLLWDNVPVYDDQGAVGEVVLVIDENDYPRAIDNTTWMTDYAIVMDEDGVEQLDLEYDGTEEESFVKYETY